MSTKQALFRARGGAGLAGSISGSLTPSCAYEAPQTSCLASTTLTANPSGGSGSYTYSWTVVSGAGVTFTAASAQVTQARRTASASGTAVVRCTISDGIGSVQVDVTLNFNHISI